MSQNAYEILALGARYVFAALMVLIVARAWRITIIDAHRAGELRKLSPETGIIGELVVLVGDGKARRGMRYPVIHEGLIGSARAADIRIRHASVQRKHADFRLTDDGLEVTSLDDAPLRDGRGRPCRTLLLSDGDMLLIGGIRLKLVFADARARFTNDDFDPDPDRLFAENPLLNRMGRREPNDDYDDLFDTGEEYEYGRNAHR